MRRLRFRLAILLFWSANFATMWSAQAPSENTALILDSRQIRTAMILWGGGAAGTVETITPAMLEGRKTWRITHYPQDPTETASSDYDLYDLDRETLAPIRSMRNTEESRLDLIFGEKEVTLRKSAGQNTSTETVPLPGAVQAEGPGLSVFVAGLPLRTGYNVRYRIVDRWSGHESTRVKMVTLEVLKKAVEDTSLGRREVYELLIKPQDNSFQIKERVLVESPHYPVWVEYTREGKTYPVSEVASLVTSSQMPIMTPKIAMGIPVRALRRYCSCSEGSIIVKKGMTVGTKEAKIPKAANRRGT